MNSCTCDYANYGGTNYVTINKIDFMLYQPPGYHANKVSTDLIQMKTWKRQAEIRDQYRKRG